MTNAQNVTKRVPAIATDVVEKDGMPVAVKFISQTGETLTADIQTLSPAIIAQLIAHGLKQKVVDAAAISRNPETGRTASVQDKWEAASAVFDRVVNQGQWNAVREGGGGGAGEGGLLVRALVQVYGKTTEQIKAYLDGKTDAEKAALRGHAKIAPVIAKIREADNARKAGAAKVDADELLAGLDGLE